MPIVDIDPPDDFPAIPAIALAVAAAESESAAILRAAGQDQVRQIKGEIHNRSGTLSRSVASTVRRLPGGGIQLKFGVLRRQTFASRKGPGGQEATRQGVFYGDFVDQGTGIHGPKGQTISRRGLIRHGSVVRIPTGAGQPAQRMFERGAENFNAKAIALDESIDRILTTHIDAAERGRR